MLPINKPILGPEEKEAVLSVLDSGMLTNPSSEGGSQVRAFEGDLAAFVKAKHAIAINSGTAALLASLLALGVGPGSEVVVPSFTFVATASAVLLAGAKPIFVDIDPYTYNMTPEAFKKAITKKTRAVIPVDLYGLPADMDAIGEVAEEKDIPVVEDACQAQGASFRGKMAGLLGDVGCFSFYPGKVMTTGEGGAIVTNDDSLAEKLGRIRTHGQVKGYDSVIIGGNFRMPEMEAAIGRVQLKKLPKFLEKRRQNAQMLRSKLDGTTLMAPIIPEGMTHNWYLFTVRCGSRAERDRLKEKLNANGIGATVYYPIPVNRTPLYTDMGYGGINLPETYKASDTVLSLPVNPLVTEDDLERMIGIIKKSQ